MAFRIEDVFYVILSVSVVLAALLPVPTAAEDATVAAESSEPETCSEVRQEFVVKGIGSSPSVPDKQVKGDDLELCPSAKTCCTKSMEEQYQEAVKKDFRIMLQDSGSYLKTLITTSASKFRETFLEMVQIAEKNMNTIFSDVYQTMEKMARVPLSQLFADLLAYINGQEIDLEDRVISFFDSLFPLAYHHASPKQSDFSETYKECLREKQREIRPFGDLPGIISAHITRSFEAARTFLQALHLGVEVLNTTEHMDYGPECRKALVRLTYCPHCQGFLAAKPCPGMCLNVMRGCLSSVSELDDSWSEYVSALERLTSGMVGTYNIEQVLSTIDTKISETIMYVMENIPEINKRVKQACGHHRRVTREVPPQSTRSPSPSSSPMGDSLTKALFPRPSDTSLYILLQNFVHKVAESKDFYSNLADKLCNDDAGLVVKGDLMCWNGQSLGEYKKTIAGVGVSAQKYNPEMTLVSRVRDMNVNTLADKLQHVKQILTSRVTSVPQSDSSIVSEGGSGSGAWWRSSSDDEDYSDGSGSGDYDKPDEKPDLHFEKTESDTGNKKTSGSWSFHCKGRTSFLILLTAILLHIRWHH